MSLRALATLFACVAGVVVLPVSVEAASPRSPAYFDVSQYGAVPDDQTDSTQPINSALDAFRAYTRQHGSALLYFPPGTYKVTGSLNFTNIRARGAAVEMEGATIDPHFNGGIAVDALGSRYLMFNGVHVESKGVWAPDYGFAVGRIDQNVADAMTINALIVVGSFAACAIYNRQSETDLWLHPVAWNSSRTGYAYCGDGINHFDTQSHFLHVSLPVDARQSFNENTIITGDFRQSGGAPAVWLAGASRHTFLGSYIGDTGGRSCGLVLYFSKKAHGSVSFLTWDVHEETSEGISDQICIDGTEALPTLSDLTVRDHYSEASQDIFKIIGDAASVNVPSLDLEINSASSTQKVFALPSKWTVSGQYHLAEGSEQWNLSSANFRGFGVIGVHKISDSSGSSK